MLREPYFMQNDDWYYYDEDKGKYVLTSNAPAKAKKSYDEFYKDEENIDY